MQVLGIDPGTTGALALVETVDDEIRLASVQPFPTREVAKGKKTATVIDLQGIVDAVSASLGSIVYMERVGAMPGNGAVAMFTFGRSVGQVEGIIEAKGLRIEYVTPQTWKARYKIRDKPEAVAVAERYFPAARPILARFTKLKRIACSEAILIARLGLELELQRVGRAAQIFAEEHCEASQ